MSNVTDDELCIYPILLDYSDVMQIWWVPIVYYVLASIVCVISIIGNVIAIYTFSFPKRKSRTTIMLTNLSVSDFCMSAFFLFPKMIMLTSDYFQCHPILCPIFLFLFPSFAKLGVLTLMFISYD
ncbi:hypothetical protein A3Q56_00280, partial [Intoshia linei]